MVLFAFGRWTRREPYARRGWIKSITANLPQFVITPLSCRVVRGESIPSMFNVPRNPTLEGAMHFCYSSLFHNLHVVLGTHSGTSQNT